MPLNAETVIKCGANPNYLPYQNPSKRPPGGAVCNPVYPDESPPNQLGEIQNKCLTSGAWHYEPSVLKMASLNPSVNLNSSVPQKKGFSIQKNVWLCQIPLRRLCVTGTEKLYQKCKTGENKNEKNENKENSETKETKNRHPTMITLNTLNIPI